MPEVSALRDTRARPAILTAQAIGQRAGTPTDGVTGSARWYKSVEMPDQRSVQGLFHDHGTRMLCEASSGFHEAKLGEPRTADLILKALYDGYDAPADNVLGFTAPFAPGLTLACDPME